MADMNLKAEVLLRLDGSQELHPVGTIDVPINFSFEAPPKPGHKPGYRLAAKLDQAGLKSNIETSLENRNR